MCIWRFALKLIALSAVSCDSSIGIMRCALLRSASFQPYDFRRLGYLGRDCDMASLRRSTVDDDLASKYAM